jgi:hypothetical protein
MGSNSSKANVVVEMKGSPDAEQELRKQEMREELKRLEEKMHGLEKDSIERLKIELEYTKLSYQLNPDTIPQKVYEDEITRLDGLLRVKISEQEHKDWKGGSSSKRTRSKKAKAKAKAKSKKSKRSKSR